MIKNCFYIKFIYICNARLIYIWFKKPPAAHAGGFFIFSITYSKTTCIKKAGYNL
jgi:hypothetical protein